MRLVDDHDRVRVGVALEEALTNALYHGNLGVDSILKEKDDCSFSRLAAERSRQSPYRERRIHVQARLTTREATISIRDEGTGFDPTTLPDPIAPANLERAQRPRSAAHPYVHGRGSLRPVRPADHDGQTPRVRADDIRPSSLASFEASARRVGEGSRRADASKLANHSFPRRTKDTTHVVFPLPPLPSSPRLTPRQRSSHPAPS